MFALALTPRLDGTNDTEHAEDDCYGGENDRSEDMDHGQGDYGIGTVTSPPCWSNSHQQCHDM